MRVYRTPCGKHIDLDHVLAISEPSLHSGGLVAIHLTVAFRDSVIALMYSYWDRPACVRFEQAPFRSEFGNQPDYERFLIAITQQVWEPLMKAWKEKGSG